MLISEGLSTVFNRYADRPFVFVRPGGNAGDHLIWHGGDKLGRVCGLNAKTLGHDAFMESTLSPDTVVYIHGGGGYNPWWSGKPMDEFEKAVMSHSGVVIQGPQTYHPDKAFLQERVVDRIQNPRAEKVYMFSRERYSHEIMKSVLPAWVELGLDHDTALNLEPSDLTPYEVASYTLYVIRRDKEAPGESAMDLTVPWMDPAIDTPKFEDWLRVHARARRIVSNRLHSAIVGSILGKPTTIIANSYMKNRAVWEFSLQQRGVQWLDEVPDMSGLGKLVNGIAPLKRVFASTPGRRYVWRFRGIV